MKCIKETIKGKLTLTRNISKSRTTHTTILSRSSIATLTLTYHLRHIAAGSHSLQSNGHIKCLSGGTLEEKTTNNMEIVEIKSARNNEI